MTQDEQRGVRATLEAMILGDDPMVARLATALLETVDWRDNDPELWLDERCFGERLLPLVVSAEQDSLSPSRLVASLASIARPLEGVVPKGFWLRLSGIVCDLAVHTARASEAESSRSRLSQSVPIVDLGRRRMLMSVVGIEDELLAAEVIDRALRTIDRLEPRRVILVLEDLRRLKEPALAQFAGECSARKIALEPVLQFRVD